MAGLRSIREAYTIHGVTEYYRVAGGSYRNPHEAEIRALIEDGVGRWNLSLGRVLDLACGSGEVTLALREMGAGQVDGIDPYTGAAYQERTGQAAEAIRFEEIAQGRLDGRWYDLIVCSFALHLIQESWLPVLLYRLGSISDQLWVVTPHQRPEIDPSWGWHLKEEIRRHRVRGRIYTWKMRDQRSGGEGDGARESVLTATI
jgi:SAM-dependent methyltransferase